MNVLQSKKRFEVLDTVSMTGLYLLFMYEAISISAICDSFCFNIQFLDIIELNGCLFMYIYIKLCVSLIFRNQSAGLTGGSLLTTLILKRLACAHLDSNTGGVTTLLSISLDFVHFFYCSYL